MNSGDPNDESLTDMDILSDEIKAMKLKPVSIKVDLMRRYMEMFY
jgi:hypothetical protein